MSFTLHTHFRMDGAWKIYPPGQRWSGGPAFEIRAILATGDHDAVGYRLPVIELVPTAAEDTVVGHLGPDLLGSDWDLDEAVRRIAAQPDRTIGEALLDQRNLAGLGTFYRAELLFLHGVHPRTPVGEVRDLRRIVERGQLLLQANRWRPEQSTTGDLRRGRRSYVYQRSGPPVSPLRNTHPYRGARAARRGTAQLLVPALPAGSMSDAILALWTR